MPGSYRGLGMIVEKNRKEKVKSDDENVSESVESDLGQDKEGTDGKWDVQQNFKFAVFVNYHENIFASKRKRKLCKIFKSLAEYLEARTPTQCRSHFQKMIAKHKSVTRMKRHFKNLFGNERYAKELLDFKTAWEQNHQPMNFLYPELKETKEIAIQTDQPEPQPSLCHSCSSRQEVRELPFNPFLFPYNVSPMTFWLGGGQQPGVSMGNYIPWLPEGLQPRGPAC